MVVETLRWRLEAGTAVKTSGILNDDGDDKSIWYVGAYNGRVIPLRIALSPDSMAPALDRPVPTARESMLRHWPVKVRPCNCRTFKKCEEENAKLTLV